MPAIRTAKSGRQNGDEPFQLTWTAPVEPSSQQIISFAPNVTPVTYTAPPPSDEDAALSESALFPDAAALDMPSLEPSTGAPANPRKRRKGPKAGDPDGNGPAHIPRPPNAFILFRSSFIKSQHVSSKIEGNHGTLSKIVGMLWHSLPHEERQVWQAKARKALAEHKKKYPEYSFRPSSKDKDKDKDKGGSGGDRGGGGGKSGETTDDAASVTSCSTRDSSVPPPPAPAKRKHREVGPRDVARCEQIAALLRKGTKGVELEEAMRAFDASRAPAVITPRFEEPITAEGFASANAFGNGNVRVDRDVRVKVEQQDAKSLRQFRRSSSAPLLDVEQTENARKQASFMQTRPPSPVVQQLPPSTQNVEGQRPSFRAHRKRSASSSPPLRSRPLVTHGSLSTINHAASYNLHAAATVLPPLNTAMQYQSTQPMSAPALSRHPTEYSLDGGETTPSGSFFEYDQATSLYDDMSPSPPSEYEFAQSQGMPMWGSSEYGFTDFSFTEASSPTDSCPHAVSPFEQSAHSQPHAQQQHQQQQPIEEDIRLLFQAYSPPSSAQQQQHHQQQPTIETSWSTAEFSYEHLPSSPTDSCDNASPTNAPSFEYDYEYDGASSFASSSGAQTPTAYDFSMASLSAPGCGSGAGLHPPASPSNASVSDGSGPGTHTQLATPDASCFGTMQLPVCMPMPVRVSASASGLSGYGLCAGRDADDARHFFEDGKMGLGLQVDGGFGGYMGGIAVNGM